MKKPAFVFQAMLALLSASPLFAAPSAAHADWWSWRRPSSRHHYGSTVVLPLGAVQIVVGGRPYFYHRGFYYWERDPREYVVVPAPVGAVVPALPEGQRTIVIDGITYHYYDGVYYKGGPVGYTVVRVYQGETGAATLPSAPAPLANGTAAGNSVVVNVPNKNGSYTPVTLQLAGNGMYIGPQGEVYPTQPTLGQLRTMYGK